MAMFSWKRVGKVVGVIVFIGVIVGGGYLAAISRKGQILIADWTKNNRENFLACEDLPFYAQVQKALTQHQDVVIKIEQIKGSKVIAREIKCKIIEGGNEFVKGDIEISYNSRAERRQIEELIGNNFFGIPWRGKQTINN